MSKPLYPWVAHNTKRGAWQRQDTGLWRSEALARFFTDHPLVRGFGDFVVFPIPHTGG